MAKFQPIIKWSGSKRSQSDEILKYFPKEIDTYYEPFCGGASILFALLKNENIKVNRYVISDINEDLINLWNMVKHNPNKLKNTYRILWTKLYTKVYILKNNNYYFDMENKNWKKILFLDIDGVLASVDFLCRTDVEKGFIDKEKVALLNKLKPYGVEVVISSSWGYNKDTVDQLTNCGLKLPIIGGTEHFHKDWLCRGNEIAKWLACTFDNYNVFTGKASSYSGKDYEYVILDDNDDMLMCQKDNFICVDSYNALLEEHIEKAIDILERKNLKK